MHPLLLSYTPADDDTNGYEAAVTGVGPFTMTVTTADDGLAHLTSLTSAANLSGINMTLTGTDADGFAQTEVVAGPNANTVEGVKYFKTLTTVAAASTLGASTMDVGWADSAVSPTIPLNWRQLDFQVSLAVNISGTINYTVQHCFDNIRLAAPSTLVWWPHASLVNDTADEDGNYAFPVTATRLLVNSSTAGATSTFNVLQGN